MKVEKCFVCHQEISYTDHYGFSRHLKEVHNIQFKREYLQRYVYVGNYLKCACGCGKDVSKSRLYPYKNMFKSGHNSFGKLNPMFGKTFSEKTKKQMSNSAKKRMVKQIQELGSLPHHTSEAKAKRAKAYSNTMLQRKCEKYGVTVLDRPSQAGAIFQCNTCDHITSVKWAGEYLCEKCFPRIRSKLENELMEFLQEYDVYFEKNTRSILPDKKELDFYLPSHKLALEISGLYWHSEKNGKKDKKYHYNKTVECNNAGVKLIHIFEDEWVDKKDIVKSRLLHMLNKSTAKKIYPRDCEIRAVKSSDKSAFLEKYHLQGSDVSKYYYGAYYGEVLVSIMTFSKANVAKGKRAAEGEWELSRFVTHPSYRIPGIAGKLLKHFIKSHSPNNIYSYADMRWSSSDSLYEKIGFVKDSTTPVNYWYFQLGKIHRQHRFNFTKQKIVKLGGDPNKTEWENMQDWGFDRIWDCGNFKYVWNSK